MSFKILHDIRTSRLPVLAVPGCGRQRRNGCRIFAAFAAAKMDWLVGGEQAASFHRP
jgi:hypothetical protein